MSIQPERFSPQAYEQQESYLSLHKKDLQDIFEILNMEWVDDLDFIVKQTQPWAKGDHNSPENSVNVSSEQEIELRSIFESLDLVREVPIEPGEYDHIIVLGAMQRANNARMSFLKKQLDSGMVNLKEDGVISLWAGQRIIDSEKEKLIIERDVTELEDVKKVTPGWLKKDVLSETDVLRLAASRTLGKLARIKVSLDMERPDLIDRYTFRTDNGQMVRLLHTESVHRPQGMPRHTTAACAKHWIETEDVSDGARVAFVSSQPYIRRTTNDVSLVFSSLGRSDIKLISGGPAAYEDVKLHLFFGEIARNLYSEKNNFDQ
jgi:hypothetical protein